MDKHYEISRRFHKLIKHDTDTRACLGFMEGIVVKSDIYCKCVGWRRDQKFHKIPTCIAGGSNHYLTVTLGSWVTPQVITALVPLMTLWSCGGLVMRVRAADTRAGCYSETVFEHRIEQSLLDLLSSFTQCLFETGWIMQHLCSEEYFARLSRSVNGNLCSENKHTHDSLE